MACIYWEINKCITAAVGLACVTAWRTTRMGINFGERPGVGCGMPCENRQSSSISSRRHCSVGGIPVTPSVHTSKCRNCRKICWWNQDSSRCDDDDVLMLFHGDVLLYSSSRKLRYANQCYASKYLLPILVSITPTTEMSPDMREISIPGTTYYTQLHTECTRCCDAARMYNRMYNT